MIAVSVTKELRFRSVWTGSVPVTDSHPLYTICAGAVSLGGGGGDSHIVWAWVCRWVRESPTLLLEQILQIL